MSIAHNMTTRNNDKEENSIPIWIAGMRKRPPSRKEFKKFCKKDIPPIKKRRLSFGTQQKKGDNQIRQLTFGEDDKKIQQQQKKGDNDQVVVVPSWLRNGDKWWDGQCFAVDNNNNCSISISKHNNSAFCVPTNYSNPSFYTYPFNKQSLLPPPPPPAPTRSTDMKTNYKKNFCRNCENVFYC